LRREEAFSQGASKLDDSYVKVAKVDGTIGWHGHADGDELFVLLRGCLCVDMENGPTELRDEELLVVPKGVRHNLSTQDECLLMLIERKTTLRTGEIVNEKTRSLTEQLRPMWRGASSQSYRRRAQYELAAVVLSWRRALGHPDFRSSDASGESARILVVRISLHRRRMHQTVCRAAWLPAHRHGKWPGRTA
jgi:mannose-6-phosphate isomerase-like protein (cupin superfamily)